MYLVEARNSKDYSQRRVAREAGMSYQHYSKIENGDRGSKVSFMIVGRISHALDIPLEEFYKKEKEYQEKIEIKLEKEN
jgi:transcriptional regulator with XRE-family HTH domain